jgi:hypothetical protein
MAKKIQYKMQYIEGKTAILGRNEGLVGAEALTPR